MFAFLPIKIDDSEVPSDLSSYLYADFSKSREQGLETLRRSLLQTNKVDYEFQDWSDFDWRKFENLIYDLLNSEGFKVQKTPPTRDGGYDFVAKTQNVLGSEEKIIMFRDTIKDDSAANIKSAITNLKGSITWSLSPKIIVPVHSEIIKGNAVTLDSQNYGASTSFVLGPYNIRELPATATGQDVGDAVSVQWAIPKNRFDNSDITIKFYLIQDNNTNTGNVRLVLGERHASDGDSISPQTVNDHANIVVAVPAVSYGKFTVEMILDGTSLDNEDSIIIHFGRDGEDSLDTHLDGIFITDM